MGFTYPPCTLWLASTCFRISDSHPCDDVFCYWWQIRLKVFSREGYFRRILVFVWRNLERGWLLGDKRIWQPVGYYIGLLFVALASPLLLLQSPQMLFVHYSSWSAFILICIFIFTNMIIINIGRVNITMTPCDVEVIPYNSVTTTSIIIIFMSLSFCVTITILITIVFVTVILITIIFITTIFSPLSS